MAHPPKPLPLAGIRVLEFALRSDPPTAGEHTHEILGTLDKENAP